MAEKQLILVVEGTAAMGHFWQSIVTDYLDKIIRLASYSSSLLFFSFLFPLSLSFLLVVLHISYYYYLESFCRRALWGGTHCGWKLSSANVELALVTYNTHGPYSACVVQRSGWTKDVDSFLQWMTSIPFCGGGFNDAAISEGLAEALMMFSGISNANQSQQNLDTRKHCILLAASNPHPLPTPVYRPLSRSIEQNESAVTQLEACLADAETVAKAFAECSISFSVISPKQLPKLRSIYNAGKQSPRSSDPSIDNAKNPQFLVLLAENFMEARSALSRPGISNLQTNQGLAKLDGASIPISGSPLTSIPAANVPGLNRQPVSANPPAGTVKMEPTTVPSVTSGPAFSHVPSIPFSTSQGIPTLVTSPASQEINSSGDSVQEFKPVVNSQSSRPLGPAPANVNILNTLSQVRLNSATIAGGNSIGLQNIGATPMAMHMSNMISNGMGSSALTGIPSVAGSGPLMATAQVSQSSGLGSFTSATSGISGNSNIGMSSSLANLQGPLGMTQPISAVGQGSLTSGSQMSQSGITMNQNVMSGLGPNVSSGSGTMIPTPGMMPQQVQPGLHSLGATNNSSVNMPLPQNVSGAQQQQSKYVKIWEGDLSGQRQGQPMLICKLEVCSPLMINFGKMFFFMFLLWEEN
ncbi:unnamed protein product [Spirodela intermedia]|uniref:Mediator of RNA polymerase II transcription subunit 25 n=1 Tax=Spirodela intermedia TaxID=51605 RepID=A0A7I8KIY0_SPIIN|nr:unnamed protein product [Spirodela intermedia]